MEIQRAFKTKLILNNKERSLFTDICGAARYVYNWGVADWRANRKEFAKSISNIELMIRLDSEIDDDLVKEAGIFGAKEEMIGDIHKLCFGRQKTKKGNFESVHYAQKRRFNAEKDTFCPWIRQYPSRVAESVFNDLGAAYKRFADRSKDPKFQAEVAKAKAQGKFYYGQPQFKSKFSSSKSFKLRAVGFAESGSIDLKNKIGRVRLAEKNYLPIDTKFNSATISEHGGDWWVSVQCAIEIDDPIVPTGPAIGVDLGVKDMAVISDGTVFENPKALRSFEKKLARLQREKDRRFVKGAKSQSSNYEKTKAKISRLHKRIADIRKHQQHEISSYVAQKSNASVVVFEDLNVKGMMAKAKPKPNEDGNGYQRNNRKAKSGLSKSIADSGMGETKRQAKYKCEWYGPQYQENDRYFASSQIHFECGYQNRDLKLSDRQWTCPNCGELVDRDLNAAKNLAAQAV